MSKEETREFKNVYSFSQLPFIRPTQGRDKPTTTTTSSSIRLFGIEVPSETSPTQQEPSATAAAAPAAGESSRRFECHYCCRNFPTSQALGGHQNAHKRERQHAKRAQLQSTVAAHYHHPPVGGHHMYRLFNYPRLHYPSSWSSSNNIHGSRFYGGLGTSVSQPIINGSPLPGLWRLPVAASAAVHGGRSVAVVDRGVPLPVFSGESSGNLASSSSSLSTQARILCESMPCHVKDHVSLDLHL